MDISKIPGHWALVTGASAGIGREFANQLASRKWNLVLVARRQDTLQLAAELQSQYSINALALTMDLADPGSAAHLRETLDKEKVVVRLLCNNVACGHMGHFADKSADDYARMIHLNTIAMVSLCREFREHLVSFSSSAIINVSSQAAYQPVPYMAVYAATKAFVHSFSQSLYFELKPQGVVVQTLVPGPTATEFDQKSTNYKPSKLPAHGTAESVVSKSLEGLVHEYPIVSNVGGLFKQRVLSALIPPKTLLREVAKIFKPPV